MRLNETQILAAHRWHTEKGASVIEIARKNYAKLGYTSADMLSKALREAFKERGLPIRPASAAIVGFEYQQRDPEPVTTVVVKPDVYEMLTARLASVYRYRAYLDRATGTCALCGGLVPLEHDNETPVGHFPDDDSHRYGPGYFCRGSNSPVAQVLPGTWRETLAAVGESTEKGHDT